MKQINEMCFAEAIIRAALSFRFAPRLILDTCRTAARRFNGHAAVICRMLSVLFLVFTGNALAEVGQIASVAAVPPTTGVDTARAEAILDRLPLSFEANNGQFDRRVKFFVRERGRHLFITDEGLVLVPQNSRDGALPVIRLQFQDRAPEARIEGIEKLPGITNYFSAGVRIADVPNYARVRQRDIYPGVDVIYYGKQAQLESDFLVAPGADPRRIKLKLSGHNSVSVADSGDLVLATSAGDIVWHKPAAYQEREGRRIDVPVRYVLSGSELGFDVAAYDPGRELVIDPLLVYSTFLYGSGSDDKIWAVAVDASGNVYLTGETTSTNFPLAGAFQTKKAGTTDAFVTKLNASGSGLVYSTYVGGKSGSTFGKGIAVDSAGSVYIAGSTSSSAYPVTTGAYRTTMGTGTPAGFVTRFTAQGNVLVYSTFVPGGQAAAIAIDSSSNVFVTGTADSTFTTTPGSFQATALATPKAYVLKLNPTGTGAVYATFLGGSGTESGNGIAVDAAGNAYVTGSTQSVDFPLANPFQPTLRGTQDAFVTKLDPTGGLAIYSTYLGGSLSDTGNAIAVDPSGRAHIGGTTFSVDFPVFRAFQSTNAYTGTNQGAITQAFITKLDASGQVLVYSSYLGGDACLAPGVYSCLGSSNNESAQAIALDAGGNAYLAGHARSVTFPQVEPIQSCADCYGASIPFVAKVQDRTSATLLYSAALGTQGNTMANGGASGVAVDPAGNVYVAGLVVDEFPTTPGAFQATPATLTLFGAYGVVFKITPGKYPTWVSTPNNGPTSADLVTLTATVTSAVPGGLVTFNDNGTPLATASVSAGTAVYTTTLPAGVHQITAVYSGDNKVSRPLFLPVRQATN
jgi:hypothetical protein